MPKATEEKAKVNPLTSSEEKEKALEAARLQIEKQYGSGSLIKLGAGASTGIEVVDLASGEIEVLFDGGVAGMALDESSQILYASVYVDWGDAPVKSINLSDKSVSELPGVVDAYNGLVFDKESKKLFIADAVGLKIYNTVTKEMITINNDLPPYSLAINP
jgi:hypothetical protein